MHAVECIFLLEALQLQAPACLETANVSDSSHDTGCATIHHLHHLKWLLCSGYREACDFARQRLESAAQSHAGSEAGLRKAVLNIAKTTLSSKILTHDKEHFANLAVDAVQRLKGSTNLDSIHIIKKTGGTLRVCPCDNEDVSTSFVQLVLMQPCQHALQLCL